MSLVSVCFAVYHNEEALPELYLRTVSDLEKNFPAHSFEFIFVNDGSKDNSLGELLKLRQKDPRVKIINFSRNFGQMAAILAGWHFANGDALVNLAADLQDPPEQIKNMIWEWEKGNEIVISYRQSHKHSLINKITSNFFYKLLLPEVPPGGFDFALIGKNAMHAINSLKERNRFFQYDILWAGFSIKFIPYDKHERKFGKSQYNLFKRFGNFMTAFLSVSYFPLRIMSLIGFIFALLGFLYSLNILYAYYFNEIPFKGWAPLMILLLIIGGMIMLSLGILGEYIWRIFDEVKGRPIYIIKEKFD